MGEKAVGYKQPIAQKGEIWGNYREIFNLSPKTVSYYY